jgi:prepilin-type N-terminal cleavage/methylation domain-containing protein
MNRRRSAGPRRRPDDHGFTLIEVTVTMGIMSVVMVIFTTAILQVYRSVNATESLSTAQSQLQVAFQRFDRELRYASWIAQPGQVGTTWYVEYAAADPTQCRQLRFETPTTPAAGVNARGVLQLIQWTRGTPPAAGARGQTVASTLVTGGADAPFERQLAGATPFADPSAAAIGENFATDFQRLRVRLATQVGGKTTAVDTTFTALNTSRDTPATNLCSEGRPTS